MFELMLVASIFLFSATGIFFGLRATERQLIYSNQRLEALRIAESELDRAYSILRSDFNKREVKGKDFGSFYSRINIKYENDASKIIESIISFDIFGRTQSVYLIRRITVPEYGLGQKTCGDNFKEEDFQKLELYKSNNISLGEGIVPTDIDVVGDFLFIGVDPVKALDPDLFIYDIKNSRSPILLKSLNTGPGIEAIQVVGNVVYAANRSINAQLQIIDIEDLENVVVLKSLKLPGAYTDGTVVGRRILYENKKLYLGTEKNSIHELHIFNAEDLRNPVWKSSYEIDAGVNAFTAERNMLYVASPSNPELLKFDTRDESHPILIDEFDAPAGVGNGKSLDRYDQTLLLGRTVGNKEIFLLQSKNTEPLASVALGASVDDAIFKQNYIFAMNSKLSDFFQIFKITSSTSIPSAEIGIEKMGNKYESADRPIAMDCDKKSFFVLTANPLKPLLIIQ